MKLEVVTLTVSKYGVTVAISAYFFAFAVVSRLGGCAPDRKAASLPLEPRVASGAGTAGEGRTFLIRSIAKVIRSDRHRLVLSDYPVDQVGQAFQCASPPTHGTSIRERQCSLWSEMVRLWSVISVIHRIQPFLVPITPFPTDRMEIQWNEPSRYEIIRRVGGGKYSEV